MGQRERLVREGGRSDRPVGEAMEITMRSRMTPVGASSDSGFFYVLGTSPRARITRESRPEMCILPIRHIFTKAPTAPCR